MKIKKINKACLGIGKEILGIKWVFLKSIDQPIKSVEALKPYVKWVHAAFDIGNN